jgi:tryptophan synthase beta chain
MTETRFGRRDPSARGYYGDYGGTFVPETLVAPVEELQAAYLEARRDEAFVAELDRLLAHYVGRPTPVYEAARLRATLPKPAARIFLKREDLAHTGAHKINNALGQALGSTASRPPPCARYWGSSATCIWAPTTWRARR